MSKSLKIFLAVLALISVGFSLAFYFGWGPLAKKEVTPKPTPTLTQQQISPTQINSSNDCVILDKENCSLGKPIYENNQLVAIGFKLPAGSKIYAPFKGQIEKNTSLVLNGVGYPAIELTDITKDDWGRQKIRTYFYVVASNFQNQIIPETLEEKQPLMILVETNVRGDYNLILTFREYDVKANQGKTNLDLLKQFFPDLGK